MKRPSQTSQTMVQRRRIGYDPFLYYMVEGQGEPLVMPREQESDCFKMGSVKQPK